MEEGTKPHTSYIIPPPLPTHTHTFFSLIPTLLFMIVCAGSATYSAAHQFLNGLNINALDDRTKTNIRLSISLNCRKTFLAILLRSMCSSSCKRGGGGDVEGVEEEAFSFPAIISALIPSNATPLPSINNNEDSLHRNENKDNNENVYGINKTNTTDIPSNIGTPTSTPTQVQVPTIPNIPITACTEEEKKKIADVAYNFLTFIRLTAFRGNPYHSSSLEYLAVSDITSIGIQQNSLTVDSVIGPLIIKIFQSNSSYGEYSSSTSSIYLEKRHSVRQNLFASFLREGMLHSLIATVAGNSILYEYY